MFKIKFSFFLIAIWFLSQTYTAQAFSITPLKYTISLAPGDSQDVLISVTNDSDQAKIYKPVVMGMRQDERGRPVFGDDIDVAENWVQPKANPTRLLPKTKQEFIFNVAVPANTPPGAHYIGLGIQEDSEQSVSGQLATILILQVAGTARESLELEKFSPVGNFFWNKNWQYSLSIKNTGNIELPLSGRIDIFSFDEKKVFSQNLNLGNKLFAQSNRAANIEASQMQANLWPGKYQALITLRYGLTNQELVSAVNFWYLPPWLLVIILMPILLFVIRFFKHDKVA